jgi:translocation and assembly module TamB
MAISEKVKKIIRRGFRIILTTILIILAIILLIIVLIQTGPVQNYGRRKMEAYIENKLHTKFRIGNLYIGFPSRIILKNIYLEDQHRDTLISGGRIEVDISMFRLFSKEIRVNELELEDVTLKVKRLMPDSVFNYQFIPDAFSSGEKKVPEKADQGQGFKFVIGTIHLHHIRAIYSDDAGGNDISVGLGDFKTVLKIFDPTHQSYSIPRIELADVSGSIRQYKPILILRHLADTVSEHNKDAKPVKLELAEINFNRVNLDYRDDIQHTDAVLHLRGFHGTVDSIDLAALHLKLKEIALDKTVARLRIGHSNSIGSKNVLPKKDTVTHAGIWSVDIGRFTVDSTDIQFDNDNIAVVKKGMDYNHLNVRDLQIHSSVLHADPHSYHARIENIALNEQSGFLLKELAAELSYNENGAYLKNLIIRTNNSEIRNNVSIRYKSPADLTKNPGDMETNLEFVSSRIAVKDILIFVPSLEEPLKDKRQAVLKLNGKMTGRLKDLRIPFLEIDGVGNTALIASGMIKGLPDFKKAYYDILLTRLKTSRADLYRFIPARSIPVNIRIPEVITANGKFTGTLNRFFIQLQAITSNGEADVKGSMDLKRKSYDIAASTKLLDLGYILKQDSLVGKISLDCTANGSGYEPRTMNSIFHVNVSDAKIEQYSYRGLLIDANLQNGNGTFVSSITDPNITYHLNAFAEFQNKYPSIKLKLQIDTVNLQALHLIGDSVQLHLALNANFISTDPDALHGQAFVNDLGLTHGSLSVHTDSISFVADHADSGQTIRIRSEAADVDWTGKYKLTQVPESIRHFLSKYYQLPVSKTHITEPQDWQMSIRLRPSPMVLAAMPAVKGTDSLTGYIRYNSSENDLKLLIHDDRIQYNQQVINQLNIEANGGDKGLDYRLSVDGAGQKGFQAHQTSLYGELTDSRLTATLLLNDKRAKSQYIVSGVLSRENRGFRFRFNPDSLLLNYQRWSLPADNFIHYDSSGLIVRNLKFGHGSESVLINTNGETTHSPLDLHFTNFKIKTISQFAEQDSLLVGGTVNGTAEVKDLLVKPLFTSDIKIDTLTYEKDTLGNLVIQVDNKELNAFMAHITLKGHDNDVQVDGKYFSGESKMDMQVKLNQLNLASFKGMAFTQVRNMKGYLKGDLHASGSLDSPLLKGSIHFENAVLVPVITGEPLKISNDVISFDEDGFNFDNFAMQDSAGNKATLDGNVYTKDFKTYKFDVTLSAQNFRLVNAPKEPNRIFYGKLNVNADIDVTGDLELPKITSYLRVNKNTDFYVILPSDDPEVVDREGVVVFTSHNKTADSANLKSFLDSLSATARLRGMDVSATIETDSSAQFTLIIDERNGDALSLRGRAELTGGVDKSGKISLTGNYELVNGAYNLTLSVLHRKFEIQRGSVITWTGDPRTANIDITAIYTVNTAPIDLLEQQISQNSSDATRYKQRLPFQVKLNMTGELMKPIIKFDIALPDNLLSLWPDVDTKLVAMRTDEAEVNKQVFALLLLGRFVQENPFQSSGGGTDAGTIARQSASKILSDQLNQLAGSLIKGVDISFDLNSEQDYSSGTAQNQTDLNVKVSKNLFDDRIRVSVGSDFQLEETNPNQNTSNIAGDVSVDYRLSKDGRYMLRVYRKDQYETVVQAQVVETGVSFILTFDYNKFRELFENKKETPVVPVPKKQHKPAPVNNSTAQ